MTYGFMIGYRVVIRRDRGDWRPRYVGQKGTVIALSKIEGLRDEACVLPDKERTLRPALKVDGWWYPVAYLERA